MTQTQIHESDKSQLSAVAHKRRIWLHLGQTQPGVVLASSSLEFSKSFSVIAKSASSEAFFALGQLCLTCGCVDGCLSFVDVCCQFVDLGCENISLCSLLLDLWATHGIPFGFVTRVNLIGIAATRNLSWSQNVFQRHRWNQT